MEISSLFFCVVTFERIVVVAGWQGPGGCDGCQQKSQEKDSCGPVNPRTEFHRHVVTGCCSHKILEDAGCPKFFCANTENVNALPVCVCGVKDVDEQRQQVARFCQQWNSRLLAVARFISSTGAGCVRVAGSQRSPSPAFTPEPSATQLAAAPSPQKWVVREESST